MFIIFGKVTFHMGVLEEKIKNHIRVIEDFPQPGISFKDFSGILQNSELSNEVIQSLASHARGKVDLVCGIESRGFLFGFPLALALDVPFVMMRKKGKLPPPTVSETYQLEYGEATLEIIENQIQLGQRVLIHDDVLATGGTARAASNLIERVGAKPVQYNFLIQLNFLQGLKNLKSDVEVISLLEF
ncbi:adenine phosphoribosyltransferase [Candidatus Ornithobacterium hominis]|uniref:adenine phosphoribosyltransferase n=1 Tax=Candidatus Ornithobacterium hominis TaxID=2497989 RepID=UPI0021AB0700|nr:adenine phosphoribosyltransferase [Candidatus Ornithobacterium hominis]